MTKENNDEHMLQSLVDWYESGNTVYLCTVIKTWGSSPRPAGSLMLVRQDGIHLGSVSGGCVEEELILSLTTDAVDKSFPVLLDYGVNKDKAAARGLPCGGKLQILVERVDSSKPFQLLLEQLRKKKRLARRVCLTTGETSLHTAEHMGLLHYQPSTISRLFGPCWELVIVGANHLGYHLARLAVMLDFSVTLCDPRRDVMCSYSSLLTDIGVATVVGMPDDLLRSMPKAQQIAVVTVTHDPKIDDMALWEALDKEFFYVGALGSRKTSAQRRNRLAELGVAEQSLARLHAPVGLDIGSHAPAEIALSIMAQVVSSKNNLAVKNTDDAELTDVSC